MSSRSFFICCIPVRSHLTSSAGQTRFRKWCQCRELRFLQYQLVYTELYHGRQRLLLMLLTVTTTRLFNILTSPCSILTKCAVSTGTLQQLQFLPCHPVCHRVLPGLPTGLAGQSDQGMWGQGQRDTSRESALVYSCHSHCY